ncbi:MAG: 50S ribosomal protein L10 [Dehalococcoidales bacterium]|nr:50S ribosomal protein L10 [Dehalococcoidales bacterium]
MPREHKTQVIEELQEIFSKATIGVVTDYRGIPTPELNLLRKKLREAGVTVKVVKNTLAEIAATKAGREDLAKSFAGPAAVIIGYDDVSKPAKILTEHIRSAKSALKIKSGFLKGKLLTDKDVQTLATLPSKEILISQVMAGIQSPIAIFVTYLSSPLSGLVNVLEGRRKKLAEAPAAAPAAAPEPASAPAPAAPPA